MKPEKNKEEEQDFLSLLAEKGGFAPIKHNHKEIDVIDLDRMRWKGKWIKGIEYKVNDLVSYQGNLYICMTDNKGEAPTTNFWELLTVINDKDSIRKGDAISLLKNDKNYITELMFMSSPLSKFRNDIGFITKEDIDWQSNVPSNEKDPIFLKHPAYTITRLDIDSWNNGLAKLRNIKIDFIGGGGGGSGGGVTTETDPIFTASPAHGIDAFDIANWNTAYGWGNHAGLYELTGTASGLIGTHESTYDHTLIATALQSLDGAWLNDTNQVDLTGDKSGSFDITTTGTGTFDHIVETTPTLLKLDQTTPQTITATDVTITASDEIYFGDATDSFKIKKDTIQGILDLVPSPDLSAYVPYTGATQDIHINNKSLSTRNYVFSKIKQGTTKNDGTVSGGVTIEDGAMKFDGVDGVVKTTGDIMPNLTTTSATINFWVYYPNLVSVRTFDGQQTIITSGGDNVSNPRWFFTLRNNTINFRLLGAVTDTMISIPQEAGNWQMITGIFNTNLSRMQFFKNGVYMTQSGVIPFEDITNKYVWLGYGTGMSYFNGSIDDVLIFNRALSQDEITQLYEQGRGRYSSVTNGLVAQYSGRDFAGTPEAPTIIYDTNDIGAIDITKYAELNGADFTGTITASSIKGVHKAADGTAAVADGTYIMGIGGTSNGTITIKDGIITAVQEAIA